MSWWHKKIRANVCKYHGDEFGTFNVGMKLVLLWIFIFAVNRQTIIIIEAMKTFNEIKAPKSGVIKKIVVLDSQPVEFGELLVIFE